MIRDGLIQRFEFTFEISHKLLKRYLRENAPSADNVDDMSFAEVVRMGNENGLFLGNWPRWRQYREMRSRTSHTHNETIAIDVVAGIPAFLDDARYLRDQLRQRWTG